MKRILSIALLCISSMAIGQVKDFSLSFSYNYLTIGESSKEEQLPILMPSSGYNQITVSPTVSETYSTKPGFNLSFDFQAYEIKNFFIRTGLSVQYFQFQRKINVEQPEGTEQIINVIPGTPIGIIYGNTVIRDADGNIIENQNVTLPEASNDLGKTSTLYIQLPIAAGVKLFNNRLQVSAGLVTSLLVYATEVKQIFSYTNSGFSINEYKEKNPESLTSVMADATAKINYTFFKKFGAHIGYQRSLTPIYEADNRVGGKTFYNSFSFGISYHF